GQAKAPTSASSASARSTNNTRLRNRHGLARGSGWSSRKRSAENGSKLVSCFRRKCSHRGAARASAPSQSQGLRNENGILLPSYFNRFRSERNTASARQGFSSVRTTQCDISRLRKRSS